MDLTPVNNTELNIAIAGMTKIFKKIQKFFEDKEATRISLSMDDYMTVYKTVYRLCTAHKNRVPHAEKLCEAYSATFEAYLSTDVASSLRRHRHHGESLLRELRRRWLNHTVMVRCVSGLMDYLNRCYLRRCCRSLPTLGDVGVVCFRDRVFDQFKGNASEIILSLVEKHRQGEVVPAEERALARSVVMEIFVAMGMGDLSRYENDFEEIMIDRTSTHYSRKSAMWVEACSCPDYMAKAEEALRREREIVGSYFHPSSEEKVVEEVRKQVLKPHAARLFENEDSGLRALVRARKTDDVKRIFGLYVHVPEELKLAAKLFETHVVEEGTGIVRGGAEEGEIIKKLMEIHSEYNDVFVMECFEDHEFFRKGLLDAFECVVNKKLGNNKPVYEHLAEFCEEMLTKGGPSEKMTEEAIHESFENAIRLLGYVFDKDLFLKLYREQFADRLLFGRSKSEDDEKCLISNLKHRFGAQYTEKLEGMVKDMALARENSELKDKAILTATVLTANHWPTYTASTGLSLPDEMASLRRAFSENYETKFPGRKLTFVNSLGTCNIRAAFESKSIELVVSTYQAIVLMLFDGRDELSYSEIKSELNIDDSDSEEELVAVLHSLSCDKYKILNKSPSSDVFEFNSKFNDKMNRIKITNPRRLMEEKKNKKKVSLAVDNDRRYSVDAAIVRIMKCRKVIKYQQLISECVEMLKDSFVPDVKLIKKRIHDLTERDFMERDENDSDTFKYLA